MKKVKISLLLSSFFLIAFTIFFSFKTTQTCADYSQGSCGSGSICYTGTPGADVAPGYQCGSAQGYVYGLDQRDNSSVVPCNTGFCCDKKAALPPLPPHQGYNLGAGDIDHIGPGCSALSICYTGSYPSDIKPGQQCGNLPGWYYGTEGGSNPHIPACGIGNAVCCDTVASTPPPPNPCPSENGVCTKIDTAVGTIDVSGPGGFVKAVFGVLLSLSGGVALILIIFSGYRIMASNGDPEKVKEAREMLTSAIIGLLFIIFSVTILQILGVDILHIPGFSK